MTPLVVLGGAGVLALLLSKKKTTATTVANAKQTPVSGSWTDTSKSIPERMALALATQQPATILQLAAELRSKGHTTQADALTREATVIQTIGVPSPLPTQTLRTASSAPAAAVPSAASTQTAAPTPASGGALDPSNVPDTLPTLGPGEVLQYVAPPQPVDMRVAQWQKFLTAIGMNPGGVDGKFGSETQAATVAFQTQAGITPDGLVGEQTIAAAKQV